jgi:hypothetical protein
MIASHTEGIRVLVADDEEPARQRLISFSSMCRCRSSMAWKW